MDIELVKIIFGALLHDFGKIVYRSNIGGHGAHSVLGAEYLAKTDFYRKIEQNSPNDAKELLDMIGCHHAGELENRRITANSSSYIISMADHIAAGIARDAREEIEGEDESLQSFVKDTPLSSIFNILNKNEGKIVYEKAKYEEILMKLSEDLAGLELSDQYVNSLLSALEEHCICVPSSICVEELCDIPLFDHLKTTAMLASCIKIYVDDMNIDDYKTEFFKNQHRFLEKQVFFMYSFDISGIQDFIYSISGSKAGKFLRARSFYLEMLSGHIVDELLECVGLSRCNLIYQGGGHAYLLFPGTEMVKAKLEQKQAEIKQWFIEKFGIKLFVAFGFTECSGNDLKNVPTGEIKNPFPEVYRRLSEKLSQAKLNRYTAKEILGFNLKEMAEGSRECTECKSSENLDEENLCGLCRDLLTISNKLVEEDVFFKISDCGDLPLPCNLYLSVCKEEELKNSHAKRFYSKNSRPAGWNFISNMIYMGDYTWDKNFSELAASDEGIQRLGVLRADVDNLGAAFVNGFVRDDSYQYATLSRTAILSRQLSFFFKLQINQILGENGGEAKVNIIYSGGDDLFIVGYWNDVIDAALHIKEGFEEFTQGTLTISAGIGLYGVTFPVKRFAYETGELEDVSKQAGKNRVTLFSKEFVFEWNTFKESVIVEKWELLNNFFEGMDTERGMAFLYRILELLRNADNKINLARLAYMLTRLEPDTSHVEKQPLYNQFAGRVMDWAADGEERKKLEAAIMIYIYGKRKKKEG